MYRLILGLDAYSSPRTANHRDKRDIYDRDGDRPHRRARDYDSDNSMDDTPPTGRYDRYGDRRYDRRDLEPRRDRHGREARDLDSRPIQDARYQDPPLQDLWIQDPRYQDPRMQDPRLQDPRIQDSPYQDPRYQEDPRGDIPVTSGRYPPYTTAYTDPTLPVYALSPSQGLGFDFASAEPRFCANIPPPTSRSGQPMYVQPVYAQVRQGTQMMVDSRTGRQVLVPVPAGAYGELRPSNRHNR
jgi:hypothetical protein